MKEIDSAYVLEWGPDEILAHLSPIRIAEYMNYKVLETTESESGHHLRVRKYDTEFTLVVRETNDGYEFSQAGNDGPFSVLEGDLRVESAGTVGDAETSSVTVDISYTIGSFFSFLLDWLSRRIVKGDANSLLDNLATGLAEERGESADDAEEGAAVEQGDGQADEQEPERERESPERTNPTIQDDRSE